MGGSSWSDDFYSSKMRSVRAAGYTSAFTHDADVKSGKVAAKVHDKLDPKNITVRESRDSDAHPTSNAVAVLFDVTGSMQQVPKVLQTKLPKLMGLLLRKQYVEDPQILFGAIGDATCDQYPFQIGQFESGIEMDDDLGRIILEGGGGGQTTESYELGMYFMARKTSIDCYEKRGKKGYLFIIGDENPYPQVSKHIVKEVFNDDLQENIPIEDIVAELKEKYEVYVIIPGGSSYFHDARIEGNWKKLFGQNVIKAEDPALICEVIASTIGLAEDASEDVLADLADAGTNKSDLDKVKRSLAVVSPNRSLKKANVEGRLVVSDEVGVDVL